MRCRLEEHCCRCSCRPIQGSHEYALLQGHLYHQCTQGPLPLGGAGQRAPLRACHARPCCVLDDTIYTTGRVGIRLIYILNCMTTFYFMITFISPQFEVFIFVSLNCMTTFLCGLGAVCLPRNCRKEKEYYFA